MQITSSSISWSKRLLILTIVVRCVVLLWGSLCSHLVQAYDTSNKHHLYTEKPVSLFYGFANWDAIYFTRIAETSDYEFEHFHAFFPLYPLLVQMIAQFLFPLACLVTTWEQTIVVSGVLLSNICFVVSVMVFYKLSQHILQNEKLALYSAMLYSITPASIFMSAMYTESMFAMFSLCGLYMLQARDNVLVACCCFALATATRANGILLCGFVMYWVMKKIQMQRCILSAVGIAIIWAPYIAFQYWAYLRYCQSETAPREWCTASLPHLYSFVQAKYWNVGLFKYYQVKQIPNFLLAAPIIGIAFVACYKYYSQNWYRTFTLGLFQQHSNNKKQNGEYLSNNDAFVHVAYLSFLLLYGLLLVHIQIMTRFLASSPAYYWFLASQTSTSSKQWTVAYFVLYGTMGTCLFTTFYPWT